MELIARNFECYPVDSSVHRLVCPLIADLNEVRFPVKVGERNSNQLKYDFDLRLESGLLAQGTIQANIKLPLHIKQQYDFAFSFGGKQVVVEVEKANWEKILRDLLKFHVYFQHGADFALLFLPKCYPHSNGESENFKLGQELYKQCLEFGFGQEARFDRILLIGYDQFTENGEGFTSAVRHRLIKEQNKNSGHLEERVFTQIGQ